MTSANVADVSVSVNTSLSSYKSDKKGKDAKEDFMSLMAGNAGNAAALAPAQGAGTEERKVTDIATTSKVNTNSYNTVENRVKKEEQPVRISNEEAKVKTDEFEESVKDVIKEELGVTEEEIEEAMETLGLSYIDLADKSNLVMLLSQLEGGEDSVSLLMNESVQDIMQAVVSLSEDLFEQTGLNIEELGMIMEEAPIPVETNIQPQTETNVPQTVAAADTDTIDSNVEDDVPVAAERMPVRTNEPEQKEAPAEAESEDTSDAVESLARIVRDTRPEGQSGRAGTETGGQQNQNNTYANTNTTAATTAVPTENIAGPAAAADNFAQAIADVDQVVEVTPYTEVNPADLVEQVVTAARTNITEQVRSMELELNPHNLGRMIMQVSEADGQITARILTQNDSVKAAMETAISNLIEKLNEQGIKVDAVEVSVATHEFEQNLEQNFADQAREDLQQAQQEAERARNIHGGINLGDPDFIENADLTEEERLQASIMRTNGNTVNFTA